MKKICTILLLMAAYNFMNAQQSADSISGTYFLQGVMETASVLELKPDSGFRFFYSYGAVDRYGSGRWTINNHEIILNSSKRPESDFKFVESKTTNDSSITIQIVDNNKMLLSYVECIISTKSGEKESTTDAEGMAYFPKEAIDSISLLFRLCPDRYSVFSSANKNFNFFQFRFEPWIAEIFFDHLILHHEKKVLTGQHPLLKGINFRYVRE